ncbi:hypothetical protein GS511_00885 [Leptospira borgpetersenii]|nr:Uncharacterized protein LB4E_0142 [Leptospira borgpetersenii str. 4E]OOV43646.1 hypothetical protein B1H38_11430 [Leptospira borgpetersenii serovar Ballum]QHE25696.1 hypothetical protein GS524_00890 [Leptospira borgpetersenii]QHE28998.1 hypothetical protein GS523_00890 [Leptospira borgpetersenii]QHE32299.1 hypothetical protein GS517_00885 [Leptospira borgpetersenii]
MKFTSDSSRLSDSKSQNPSLLCQKDQAAKFCLNFGTEPYIELILYMVSFLLIPIKQSTVNLSINPAFDEEF